MVPTTGKRQIIINDDGSDANMDKYRSLKQKLAGCEKVAMANIMLLSSPLMLSAFENADCILLDKEHGVFGNEELIPMTMQCRHLGIPAIVRVEDKQYHLIAKAIDLGADGIMLPRVESVEQVKTAVDAMHFAPAGRTGFGGFGLLRDGETFEDFDHDRILLVQIESPAGLDCMEDMIKAYGEYIDGFVIGPNDFSIMCGVPFQHDHPVMLAQYEKFYEICHRYNKSCGIFDPDEKSIKRDTAYGANIFWLSDDLSYLKAGFEMLRKSLYD